LCEEIDKIVVFDDTPPVVVAARLKPFHVLLRSITVPQ